MVGATVDGANVGERVDGAGDGGTKLSGVGEADKTVGLSVGCDVGTTVGNDDGMLEGLCVGADIGK